MTKETKKKIRLILWLAVFAIIFIQSTGNHPDVFYWITSAIGLLLLAVLFFMREPPKKKSEDRQ